VEERGHHLESKLDKLLGIAREPNDVRGPPGRNPRDLSGPER
jgi:hypothetical protein